MAAQTGRLHVVAPEGAVRRGGPPAAGEVAPGEFIRQQRERRRMSLEQLAAATKIPRRSLAHLEAGRFDELPGPVFVRGFFRCCARALGLDTEMVIELLYEQERAALQARRRERPTTGSVPIANESPERKRSRITRWLRLPRRLPATTTLLWILIVLVVLLLVLSAFNLSGGPGQTIPQA
jgi:cytoskeletal protein RodZ